MSDIVEPDAAASANTGVQSDHLLRFAYSGGLLLVIILLVGVAILFVPNFLSPFNQYTLTRNLGVDIIIGFGMMVVLGLGHMNLALGAIGACAAMTVGFGLQSLGLPIPLAILGAIIVGVVLGALNGVLVVRTGLDSFIITLATASLYFGLMFILTRAEAFRNLPAEFSALGKGRIGPYSSYLLIAIVVGAMLFALFSFSELGRRILATGANRTAADLSGIPVERVIVVTHAISGAIAAIAGVMVTARLASALPSTGEEWLLPSFLAPLLGGTLLAGGFVSVIGTALGAILLSVLQNTLVLLNISGFWIQFFLGLALLIAVGMDRWRVVQTEKRGTPG